VLNDAELTPPHTAPTCHTHGAHTQGNASRFINHSCAPNCELQKWNVRGFTRIGIMANQDIPAGTALSYDYQVGLKLFIWLLAVVCACVCMYGRVEAGGSGDHHILLLVYPLTPQLQPHPHPQQFATNEEGKFACHCGAATCRGSLAPKPKFSEDEEMEMLRQGGSRCVASLIWLALLGWTGAAWLIVWYVWLGELVCLW
jgi:hypothetical protein